MKKSIALLALFCIAACDQQESTFTDTRDGKKYNTVKIGEQVWMAENLNYDAEGNRCYNDSISYCDKYGRLYDWATAMKACPKGWHLPSNAEWDKLLRFVDDTSGTESPYHSKTTAGKHLRLTSGWNELGSGWDEFNNGEDTYGFSALPGGCGDSGVGFYGVDYKVYWWSSSEHSSESAYYLDMLYTSEGASFNKHSKDYLRSVRCVKD
ncbi:MAG: fibrobacter succinogenes major paralogous domain-containing protein [Fibromonadaceae bacterium]|jgi:uncharacterized protein (TIGR02145 family)|nr:fibrobacter succinogenes major paralogous domain-containing protein [Fibromonadaceae bacterium]